MRLPNRSVYLVLLVFLGILASCDILGSGPCMNGSGEVMTEERKVASFTGIDMRLPGKVTISPGPKASVAISSFKNLLSEISTQVEGNMLVIKSESCLEFSNEETKVVVTLPLAEHIALKSNGEITMTAVPSAKLLQLTLSGSGSIRYSGQTKQINVTHSSSGNIYLEGVTQKLQSTLSGSGQLQGFLLNADTVFATLSGSGSQQVWVNSYLDGTVKGSGSIFYRGWPNTLITETSGSGKVLNDN